MKTSGKILWISLAAIVAVLAILLMITKSIIGRSVEVDKVITGDTTVTEVIIDIDGFTGIEASGVWDVEITQGNDFDVIITVPEYLKESLKIRRSGELLDLAFKEGVRINFKSIEKLKATITMPALSAIEISGGANVVFSGFRTKTLAIDSSGASNIIGQNNEVDDLKLSSSGAVHVGLKKSKVKNMDIDLSGAGAVEVTMTGGELTGSMSGAAVLEYWGQVTRQNVDTSGVAKVNSN
jgi:hypothetical protein